MRTIQTVNMSNHLQPEAVVAAVSALQAQLDAHFGPLWGMSATLQPPSDYDPKREAIILLDDADQAGALGYHELVKNSTVPIGFVFCRTAQLCGVPWTSVFSHELLEQLVDPLCGVAWCGRWGQRFAAIALEIADPVEQDLYDIDGVAVSNFVLPAWFDASAQGEQPFDFLGLCSTPCTLRPGGYISVSYTLRGWKQIFASAGKVSAYRQHPKNDLYSRKVRRIAA